MGAVMLTMFLPGVWPVYGQSVDTAPTYRSAPHASQILELKKYLALTSGAPDAYARVVRAAFERSQSGALKMMAYEENQSYVCAVARMQSNKDAESSGRSTGGVTRWIRRLIILNPSVFILEDELLTPYSTGMNIGGLFATTPPRVSGRTAHILEPSGEISTEILFPRKATYQVKRSTNGQEPGSYLLEATPTENTPSARFVQVLSVGTNAPASGALHSDVTTETGAWKLTATIGGKVFKLTLPPPADGAGEIAIATLDGKTLVGNRPFPSGILPHGPEGNRLLEIWDSDYRQTQPALWDIGRPADELQKVVEGGSVPRCRVVDMCCGSGTDAIYLASKGFDVTAIDVAPTALGQALEKGRKAKASVHWMVADILAPPDLKPFDFVYDRGCYHVVRDQNLTSYLETIRRFSHPGTQFLLLASRRTELSEGERSGVTEEELRFDFLTLFDVEWLREIRLESTRPGIGPPGWSAFLRRNAAP
jgi:SAM-dependent methyltransferase